MTIHILLNIYFLSCMTIHILLIIYDCSYMFSIYNMFFIVPISFSCNNMHVTIKDLLLWCLPSSLVDSNCQYNYECILYTILSIIYCCSYMTVHILLNIYSLSCMTIHILLIIYDSSHMFFHIYYVFHCTNKFFM